MNLNEFLVEAKVNTYASQGEGGETRLDDGSKELVFEHGGFKYRDRYFGSKLFAGEEVVWEGGEYVWGMNYYGGATDEEASAASIYNFLKEALQRVPLEAPYRGPENLVIGDYDYQNKINGTIENFSGIERILYKNKEIYSLKYHGGDLKRYI